MVIKNSNSENEQPIVCSENKKSQWAVAWMSFLWSTSSLMVFSIMPSFVTEELGASHSDLGVLEGVAICCAFAAKVFSGVGSDYWRKRKPFILVGTLVSLLSKPLFAFSYTFQGLFFARFLDRFSKGVRSSPTDALIADLSTDRLAYGRAYGFRQAFYTLGAVCGATLAIIFMSLSGNDYRLVFACASLPMLIALFLIFFRVQESAQDPKIPPPRKWCLADIKRLPKSFWYVMVIAFFLMMARFSEAFVCLRAKELGWGIAYLPAIIILMDIVHAGVAYPSGYLADRFDRKRLLAFGLFVFLLAVTVFAKADTLLDVGIGIVLLGIHMGLTQGLLRALVAEATPLNLRGTAFAIFNLVSGFAVFFGNVSAGRLSDAYGLWSAFAGASFFIIISGVLVVAGKEAPRLRTIF